MKKCSNCGKENLDEAIFCAECGTKLNEESNDIPENLNKNDSPITSDSPRPQPKSFREKFKKDPALYCCCFFPLIFIGLISMASDGNLFIKSLHPEDYDTLYPDEYNNLDLNNDGKLEFSEVNNIVFHTPQEMLYKIFQQSDKNNNGYLIDYEYDIFKRKAEGNVYEKDYRKLMEEKERNASKKKGKNHSGTNRYVNELNNQEFDREEGYVLTCPYCGSEAIYETGGYYRCAECGSSIYSVDDLELGYGEGYMELLIPISLLVT